VQAQYWQTILAVGHTATLPGRFNAGSPQQPGFKTFYMAEDQQVAMFEANALLGWPMPGLMYLPNPHYAWIVVNLQVRLSHIADLTNRREQRLIGTSPQELTGDWRGYALRDPRPVLLPPYTRCPTQQLGAALFATPDIEGFLTWSAKVPTKRNLVLFPDKLHRSSVVRFQNPFTQQWEDLLP
jgi:RES domain-containing protein